MNDPEKRTMIIGPDNTVLVTGAAGFIGTRVVERLLDLGFRNIRCFVRPSSNCTRLQAVIARNAQATIKIVQGNLLSPKDCASAAQDVAVIYHLAAGRGEKMYADAFTNSVVTTRNLLEASKAHGCLKRFVSVSSFSVYSNRNKPHGRLLDESCPIEPKPQLRGDAYTYAKVKQDQIIEQYGTNFGIPYVIVRPGYVYGSGNENITNRVGIGTFGLFLHLGGSNSIPFTYVDNCADAIVLAGLVPGVDGEVFNVVDDDLPSSRWFLRLYKQKVRSFRSIYLPHAMSYLFCWLWEKYSKWSKGQLPPSFNRLIWHAYWKKTEYSNQKLKDRLGWKPAVTSTEGLDRFFESCRLKGKHA